jgi:DNA-binding transcriptional LysR family regulator
MSWAMSINAGTRDSRVPEANARWQAIEVRHLVALAAVAYEGSFRRAADQLGYVQSAISGQIARLEHAAGIRLLDRASGTPVVELTEAGRVLLRHTEEILARFETAYSDVSSLADRSAGMVRVAGLESFSPGQTARILGLFRQRHPFARLVLADPGSAGSGVALETGTVDLLIGGHQPVGSGVKQIVLERDEYVLLVKAGSELTQRDDPLDVATLSDLRPIVPSSGSTGGGAAAQLRELGVRESAVVTPASVATAQALVGAGLGAALVPSRLVDRRDTSTVAMDLSHLLAAETILLAWSEERPRSAAVLGFVNVLVEVCTVAGTDDREVSADSEGRLGPSASGYRAA